MAADESEAPRLSRQEILADAVVMGVDPGLAALGWGVLRFTRGRPSYVAHGAYHTPAELDEWDRVAAQARNLRAVARTHGVNVVGVEGWGFYRDCVPVEAHRIGLIIGAVLTLDALVISAGLAAEWRKSLGLPMQCSKADVQRYIQAALRLKTRPTPQHASDALAVALVTYPLAVGRSRPTPRKEPTPP